MGNGAGEEWFGLQRGSWLLHRKAQVILAVELPRGERSSEPRCRQCELASGYKVCSLGDGRSYSLYRLGRTHIQTLVGVGAGVPAPAPEEGISKELPSWS